MMANERIKIKRDVTVTQVPFGNEINLPKDTEVTITQSLGDTYTVTANGQMFRVASKDIDALGKSATIFTLAEDDSTSLEDKIWSQLRTVYDPEIPVNIVDLGLVYGIEVKPAENNLHTVIIRMTLTSPGCGMGPIIASDAQQKVAKIVGVKDVEIEMVFDPPWDRSMMSEQAKLELGLL
jgi:probable FeS assembly SUF system protein SufT